MKVIKKTEEYTVYQKRSGRHALKGADGQMINGEEKAKILLAEGLIKLAAEAKPEPVVEEVAEESEAEPEVASEEAPAEEAAPEAVEAEGEEASKE